MRAVASLRLGLVSAALLLASVPTFAQPVVGDTSKSLCFALVADRSQIPEHLLRSVAKIESNFKADAVHFNTDGTRDVGIMQVNSSHFAELDSKYHITEQMLLDRPCLNIAVGARILGGFLQKYGPTWRAVGSYGAGIATGKERARLQYANIVARAFARRWHTDQVTTAAARVVTRSRMVVVE